MQDKTKTGQTQDTQDQEIEKERQVNLQSEDQQHFQDCLILTQVLQHFQTPVIQDKVCH